MNKRDLGKGVIIYYDVENKIIGRKPTNSNLIEHGSDNSIYLGLVGNSFNEVICSIFNLDDINDFTNKNYIMSFYGDDVQVNCNINDNKQLQLKVVGDGHIFKLLSKYEKNINKITNFDKLLIFFDFLNMEIFFEELNDTSSNCESSNVSHEKQDIERIVNKSKQIIKENECVDINGYIETIINVSNTFVQKKFRNDLVIEFDGKCALCNINRKELLRASHIKSYSECSTVNEMIDYNNGLLLCVNHDALFDKGFISFDCNNGKIKIVDESILSKELYDLLNINENMKLDKKFITSKRKKYLATHKLKNNC